MKFKKLLCVLLTAVCMFGTTLPIENADVFGLSVTASAASKPSAPKNIKVSLKENRVTIKWSAVKGADAYRVYKYDKAKKKYVRVKTVKGTKATVSDLQTGKNYFKIISAVKNNGKYTNGYSTKRITVTVKNSSSSESSSKNNGMTAVELSKEMGNGWNLGNTMEAVATWLGNNPTANQFEQAWGQPITTKAMITGLKNAGVKSVRVPVAWSNMMDKDYKISDDYFKRVDEIVGYVLDNDMYCVVNIHWDGGWWEDFGSSDDKKVEAAWDKYESMWKQIAEHYKDYSDKLIFESANEELGDKTRGKRGIIDSYKIVNEINQKFVDVVRGTGSNNKDRFLLIAGYNTDIYKTCDRNYKMPSDTAKNKLLVSVHYYSPATYCIADTETNSWGYADSWGTKSEKDAMRKDLEKMKKFTDAGYGVIIGEYGVAEKKVGNKYEAKDGSDEFIGTMIELCEEYGYCPMLWDTGAWYNRNGGKFNDDDIAKIFK